MIKVTYIQHSSFLIELDHHVLLFDYAQGTLPAWAKEKPLYVFVSHAHGDHFTPAIFQLPAKAFLLGFELDGDERIHSLQAHEQMVLDDLCISTFFSTDEGVAFLIECEGQRIYHAGDLHHWHWMDDEEVQVQWMKDHFEQEMHRLAPYEPTIAFVVLDPRLEESKEEGIEIFYSLVKAKDVFPMHLWGDYALAKWYKEKYGRTNLHIYDTEGTQYVWDECQCGEKVKNK